jgi:SAM-dependent methyltransferase
MIKFHQGNMLDFDLGERFDAATCLGGAIAGTRTPDGLKTTVANIVRHVRPGGVVVIEPWLRPDVYVAGTVNGDFFDEPDRKIARIALTRREGDLALIEFNYLVGTPQGVHHFTELHMLGLFTRDQMSAAFEEAGLDVVYEKPDVFRRGLHIGVKPAGHSARR